MFRVGSGSGYDVYMPEPEPGKKLILSSKSDPKSEQYIGDPPRSDPERRRIGSVPNAILTHGGASSDKAVGYLIYYVTWFRNKIIISAHGGASPHTRLLAALSTMSHVTLADTCWAHDRTWRARKDCQ